MPQHKAAPELADAEAHAIAHNLFPSARQILKDRPDFPWHRDESGRATGCLIHSSQALAVDVFWTIRSLRSRDRIVDAWCRYLGLPYQGSWSIELEERPDEALMAEPRSTQIDAVVRCSTGLLVIECKFTERDGGSCSQTSPLRGTGPNAGKRQCTGNYETQINPVNGIQSRCSLTAKGIRYWELIPAALGLDSSIDYRPCPFRGGWYQWMRNLVAAFQLGRAHGVPSAFVLTYVAGQNSIARKMAPSKLQEASDWQQFGRLVANGSVPTLASTYQDLLRIAQSAAEPPDRPVVIELTQWVERKIRETEFPPRGEPGTGQGEPHGRSRF